MSTRCSSTRGPARRALLGDMAHQDGRRPVRFGQLASWWAQPRTCTTDPGVDSSSGSQTVWMESIDQDVGLDLVHGGQDGRAWTSRPPSTARHEGAEALGPAADLGGRLLCGYQQAPRPRRGQGGQRLQHQGRLADPGLPPEQGDRARHQPAAEHPVQLGPSVGTGAPRRRRCRSGRRAGASSPAAAGAAGPVGTRRRHHAAAGRSISSTSEFHAPHAGQRPVHAGDVDAHSPQRWTVRVRPRAHTRGGVGPFRASRRAP